MKHGCDERAASADMMKGRGTAAKGVGVCDMVASHTHSHTHNCNRNHDNMARYAANDAENIYKKKIRKICE